jgi:hypothetical protein
MKLDIYSTENQIYAVSDTSLPHALMVAYFKYVGMKIMVVSTKYRQMDVTYIHMTITHVGIPSSEQSNMFTVQRMEFQHV